MSDEVTPATPQTEGNPPAGVRSLRELLDRVSGRGFHAALPPEETRIADVQPFPFLALVGQPDMKLALMLALVNPAVGGVLLVGPRGTGKTTAVRALVDLLPSVPRSLCFYGCMPEDIEAGGMDAVCPDCARKFAQGEDLARPDRVRLVELPLNARLDDVVGGMDERAAAATHSRMRLRRGLLAQADRNLLYVDEVNLLESVVVDALLDAAAQGSFTMRRGSLAATFWSRFVLVGSMNPEEGTLRPQILDRFGLRVLVHGLADPAERLEAYRRVQAYQRSPRGVSAAYAGETALAQSEIQAARQALPGVGLPEATAQMGLDLISHLNIDSLRAEITLFEAARAYTAADGRQEVTPADLRSVAPLALRLRRSAFMKAYFDLQKTEEVELQSLLAERLPDETISSQ